MKKTHSGYMALTVMLSALWNMAVAQVPLDYYSSLNGKKGAELKTAVHNLVKKAQVLEYGSGKGHTWEGFYKTDRNEDNSVVDRYSNDVRYFTSTSSAVGGMNIEHSFPKSWWGGAKTQAYKDLYNLMPSETKINSAKGNYPMGEVVNASTDNGCTKVGSGSNGYKLWEPADKWKGDFARGYMYMATAYQDYTWQGESASRILTTGDYPTLQEWAYTLYIKWAKEDNVDKIEVRRNNEVSKMQGNRNPFVDFPNLMEYIWGDSINYAFDIAKTVKSDVTSGGVTPDPDPEYTIYSQSFTSGNTGDFTIENVSGGIDVWTMDNRYGWKGTGYADGVKNAAEAMLVSPVIDLTQHAEATLSFNHAVNYFTNRDERVWLEIRTENGEPTRMDVPNWSVTSKWDFVDSGDISLNDFTGKKINIVFHYTSTDTDAGTWEIRKMLVTGKASSSGIGSVEDGSGGIDLSKPYKAYSVSGQLVNPSAYRGVMIIRQGGKSVKVMVK